MNTAAVLPIQTTELTCREWHIVPDATHSNRFNLETITGGTAEKTMVFTPVCTAVSRLQ